MDIQRWLIRARRWSQKPPSARRVKMIFGMIAACLAIAAIEYVFGWPDWLSVQKIKF